MKETIPLGTKVVEAPKYPNQWILPDGRVWSLAINGFKRQFSDEKGLYCNMIVNLGSGPNKVYVTELIENYNDLIKTV